MIEKKGGYSKPLINKIQEESARRQGTVEERKSKFKAKLRELFESGKNPQDISIEMLADILNIERQNKESADYEKELTKRVEGKIRPLFSRLTRKKVVEMLYSFYLEDKAKEEENNQ